VLVGPDRAADTEAGAIVKADEFATETVAETLPARKDDGAGKLDGGGLALAAGGKHLPLA
jgi:hypothetical protein